MGVELAHICRASFDKIVPFFVKEQSFRSCLCVNCYKAKLITVGLHENWATLHHGANAGDRCSCTCDFCEGGCGGFLKNKSPKTVFSMGKFSDSLLCTKEHLYEGKAGKPILGHRLACVSGHCPDCQKKQECFFKCPRHQGDVIGPSSPSPSPSTGDSGEQPGIIHWKEFANVEEPDRPSPPR